MLRVSGLFDDGGSSPVDSARVNVLQRGLCSPGDFCGRVHHTLHSNSAVSLGKAVGQDRVNDAVVEVAQDFG